MREDALKNNVYLYYIVTDDFSIFRKMRMNFTFFVKH